MKLKVWAFLLLGPLLACAARGQDETIYMAVLSALGPPYGVDGSPRFGLFVSTDKGSSWRHKGWEDYIRTFYAEEASNGVIWAACGNGVLRSTDCGASWRVTTGWEVTEVLKVKAARSDPRVVFAATAYGIIRSTDGGDSWEKVSLGIRPPFSADVCIDRNKWRHVLAATEVGIYRTEDGGERWVESGLAGKGIRLLVQDPFDERRFWAGTEEDGVFVSEDRGQHWVQRAEGLTDLTVYSIAVHPSKRNHLYAGTFGGGVFASTDGGLHWEQSVRGLTDLQVHALVVSSSDPELLLAGTLNDGLFRSTDGGATWEYLTQEHSEVWGLSLRSARGTDD